MNYAYELLANHPELISMCGDELHPDCVTACELEARDYSGQCACNEAIRKKRFFLNQQALITKYRNHHARHN